jgi:hypothetical protein
LWAPPIIWSTGTEVIFFSPVCVISIMFTVHPFLSFRREERREDRKRIGR